MARNVVNLSGASDAVRQSLRWQFETRLRIATRLKCSDEVLQRLRTASAAALTGKEVRIERGMPRAPKSPSTGRPDPKRDWKRIEGDMHVRPLERVA